MSAYTTVEDIVGRAYEFVPDGVHLHLPDELYFAQDALGSSDLIRLHKYKHGWWWQSRWNPDHVEKAGPERNYGSATHSLVLEGIPAYEAAFAVQPEKPKTGIFAAVDVKRVLIERGFSVRGTSGWHAADWLKAAADNLPDVPCWPNMITEFQQTQAGRESVTAVEDRMLRIMHKAAMDDPGILALLGQDHALPPLAEVSVLKTLPDGTRRRWRIDRLYPKFTLDLKTLGNWSGRPLNFAVGDHIGLNGYDVQRADYDNGRAALTEYVTDGFQVFGGSVEERGWLKRLVGMSLPGESALPPSWDWVWLFYQKPEPTGRAPVIFPVYDDAHSALWAHGRRKAHHAMDFYREQVGRFGLLKPWTHVAGVHYTDPDLEPHVTLPHWIAEDEPESGAAYQPSAADAAA